MARHDNFLSRWRGAWMYPETIAALACGLDDIVVAQTYLKEQNVHRPASVEEAFQHFERDEGLSWQTVEAFVSLPAFLELKSDRQRSLYNRIEVLRRRVTFRLERRLRLLKVRASDLSTDLVGFLASLDFSNLSEVEQALRVAEDELGGVEARECGRLIQELKGMSSSRLFEASVARASTSQDVRFLRLLKSHILRSSSGHPGVAMLEELVFLEPPDLWPYRAQALVASANVLLGTVPQRLKDINIRRWIPRSDDTPAMELLKYLRDLASAPDVSTSDCVELLQRTFHSFSERGEQPDVQVVAEASGVILASIRGWLPGRFLSGDGAVQVLCSARDVKIPDDYESWVAAHLASDRLLLIFDVWHQGLANLSKAPRLTSDDIFTYLHRIDRDTLLVRRILHLMEPESLFAQGGGMSILLEALLNDAREAERETQFKGAALVRLLATAALSQCGWLPVDLGQIDGLMFFCGDNPRALHLALWRLYVNANRAELAMRDLFGRERIGRLADDDEFKSGILSLALFDIDISDPKTSRLMTAIIDWVYVTDGEPFELDDIVGIVDDDVVMRADVERLVRQLSVNGLVGLLDSGRVIVDRAWAFYLVKELMLEDG